MKPTILIVALLIAGCAEQAVEKSFADPCLYCGKPYEQVGIDASDTTKSWHKWKETNQVVWDSNQLTAEWCSLYVYVPPSNYREMIDFAAWCQKAHPDVWREYYSTTTKGR